jgi:hypothetical protein
VVCRQARDGGAVEEPSFGLAQDDRDLRRPTWQALARP